MDSESDIREVLSGHSPCGSSNCFDDSGQFQRPHHVAEIVGQRMKAQPNLVAAEFSTALLLCPPSLAERRSSIPQLVSNMPSLRVRIAQIAPPNRRQWQHDGHPWSATSSRSAPSGRSRPLSVQAPCDPRWPRGPPSRKATCFSLWWRSGRSTRIPGLRRTQGSIPESSTRPRCDWNCQN